MTFEYITTLDQLSNSIDKINKCSVISVDLEFDKNRYRYGFNLCLLQIKAGEDIFLIDPISENMDISPVFVPLENPNIQKIVYAFGEDIRLLHSVGCKPRNLFDISIQTRLLDYPAISLTNLLLNEQGVECGKSSQKSNWFKRPLTKEQLVYAAEDVAYLEVLKNSIEKQQSEEITEWIKDENYQYEVVTYLEDGDSCYLKNSDKKELTEYQWYIFKGLMGFREQVAREVNRPSFFVLDKEYLRDLAINPAQLKRWNKLKSIYRKIHNELFKVRLQGILSALIVQAKELKLSVKELEVKKLSVKELELTREVRKKRDKLIKEILKPIQQLIVRDYGENTASFILSNRIMQQICSKGLNALPSYKQELIKKCGSRLGVDLSFTKEITQNERN